MDQAANDMLNLLYTIPNIPYDSVPEGVGAEDNVVEKMGGMETQLPTDALPHWELAKKYDLILCITSFVIHFDYLGNCFFGSFEVFFLQTADYRVGVFCNLFNGKHIYTLFMNFLL